MEDQMIETEFYSSLTKKRLADTFIARNYDLPIKNYLGMIETIIEQNERKEVAWKTAMMGTTESTEPTDQKDEPREPNDDSKNDPTDASSDHTMLSPFFVPELKYLRTLIMLLNKVETQEELISFKRNLTDDENFAAVLEVKEQEFWILAFIEWMTQIMRKLAFYFLDYQPESKK